MPAFLRRFVPLTLVFAAFAAPVWVRAADENEEADPYCESFYAAHIISLTHANLAIGVAGDAIAKKTYEGDAAVTVATAIVNLNEGAHKILVDLSKSDDVDEEDAELLKKLAKAAALIKQQADGVVTIAKGGDGTDFGKARTATEKALKEAIDAVNKAFEE